MDAEDFEIIDREECLGEHQASDARKLSNSSGQDGETREIFNVSFKVASLGDFVTVEGDGAVCESGSDSGEGSDEESATDSEDESETDEESEEEAEEALAPQGSAARVEGVPQGPATPQPAAPLPLRRRVQRHSGRDVLYSADVWDPLPSGQNVEEFLEEDAAYFANNRGKFAAFVAVLVVLHMIPIVRFALWSRSDAQLSSVVGAFVALREFNTGRAPDPHLGSELSLLQYQTVATERLIEARSTFKREVAAGKTRRPHRHVARQVKRALKAINHDIKAVSTCFNDLGRALHGALELDRTILLHLADHLKEAYGAMMDRDAEGSDVQASLLMGPVAGFESTLAHVVSSYSSAATDLATICTDLGSKGANAGVTASDLRRMEVVAAAQSAICVPQLETLRRPPGQHGADCGVPAPICHNPGMDRVLERLLASRGLYHALLAALGANTTGLVKSTLPALALPPAAVPRLEDQRGKPLLSFPVLYSNFITTLQLEGIID